MDKNEIKCKGYLNKWTNFIKGWRLRYFTLVDCSLYYTKKEDTDKNKKEIKLFQFKLKDEKRKKQFLLERTPLVIEKEEKEVIYLKTNTEEEKIMWIEKLTEAIAKACKIHNDIENENMKYIEEVTTRQSSKSYCAYIKNYYEDNFTFKHDELISNVKDFHKFYLNFHMDLENFQIDPKTTYQEMEKVIEKMKKYKSDFKVNK